MGRGTRPRGTPLYVWTNDRERAAIQERASATGLSVSAYLRTLGIGHAPRSLFDQDAVLALVRLHADQGRLGGLLKLWLSTRPGAGAPARDVRALLHQIEQLQAQLKAIVQTVRP